MVVTFVSNYINHHQLPFCEAMKSIGEDIEFYFVQTMPMEEKRVSMGWAVDERALSYVVLYYEDEGRAGELIENSDVVLFGWTDNLISDIQRKRLSSGKLSFVVSERIYREGQWKFISPRGLLNKYREHFVYRHSNVYLLCTGAYVASDFNLIKSYPGKMLRWGYFPDASGVVKKTSPGAAYKDKIRLCWAGRLIDLKHPEFAVKIAAHLKRSKRLFSMDIVGDGPLRPFLEDMVKREELSEFVSFKGAMPPGEVLGVMDEADIFLFTSNYLEGWGAVVNEAMERGCAVVASIEAGAVPFLIEDNVNGLVYKNGSYDDFEKKVDHLFENRQKIGIFAQAAQMTIKSLWNAKNAAGELVRFSREVLAKKEALPADRGPMSRADIIKAPGFFRTLQEKNHLE